MDVDEPGPNLSVSFHKYNSNVTEISSLFFCRAVLAVLKGVRDRRTPGSKSFIKEESFYQYTIGYAENNIVLRLFLTGTVFCVFDRESVCLIRWRRCLCGFVIWGL